MLKLPYFQSGDQTLQLLQSKWLAILNPLLANPVLDGVLLTNVSLVAGPNAVNHKLGRKLQGWVIVRLKGPAAIYDTQDNNQMPQLTLDLVSSANVNIDLYCF